MPRLLEKSVLFEETLVKPFPPVTMDSESIKGNRAEGKFTMPTVLLGKAVTPGHLPGLLSYPAVTAAKVGLPFLPGSEAAFANLCLLPFGCLVLGSLKEKGNREQLIPCQHCPWRPEGHLS